MTTIADLRAEYRHRGFIGPIRVVDADVARAQRAQMEWAESQVGPLHYQDKMHTVLTSVWELVTNERLLDAVEACIGPDILLYNSTFIVKEPHSAAKVNWHQDLTYWGLSDDDAQVSAWIALSPATAESGCMQMIPGSHAGGRVEHCTPDRKAANDVLDLGQYIPDVDTASAVHLPLEPGEASLHHGWTIHASMPNVSDDRRIGVNAQFLAPHCRQLMHGGDTAVLLRGVDRFGNFGAEHAAEHDLDPTALERQRAAHQLIKDNYRAVRERG